MLREHNREFGNDSEILPENVWSRVTREVGVRKSIDHASERVVKTRGLSNDPEARQGMESGSEDGIPGERGIWTANKRQVLGGIIYGEVFMDVIIRCKSQCWICPARGYGFTRPFRYPNMCRWRKCQITRTHSSVRREAQHPDPDWIT